MSRRSIFDIITANWDLSTELDTVAYLFNRPNMLFRYKNSYCIEKFIDKFLFATWSSRGTCISTTQMKSKLDIGPDVQFDDIDLENGNDYNIMLSRLEYISNMIYLIDSKPISDLEIPGEFDMLNDNFEQILEHICYCQTIDKKTERVLIIPKDAAVTAAAEIADDSAVPYILQYHHFLLKGDIEQKARILNALGAEIEPKRKELNQRNPKLSEAVFFMLNNMNIRHNNISNGNNYKEVVAKMSKNEVEEWYDETYQLILLAYLEIDNIGRLSKIEDLKGKMR